MILAMASFEPTTTPDDRIAVTAEIFRGGVNDDIDAMLDRFLKERRCPGIVDDCGNTGLLCHGRQRRNVLKLEDEGCGVFEVEQLGARQGLADLVVVGGIDEIHRDTEPAEQLHQKAVDIVVEMANGNDPVSRLNETENCRSNGGRSARESAPILCALEAGDQEFEFADRRIVAARIDIVASAAKRRHPPSPRNCRR